VNAFIRWAAHRGGALMLAAALWLPWAPASANFALAVSPPRFEFEVPAGGTARQVLELAHAGAAAGPYRVYSVDWTLDAAGELRFSEALLPGSCRPWVALERREVVMAPASKLRFRFEVTVPVGAEPTECRFALMLEAGEAAVSGGPASVPMSGRIAVIVYARTGGVRADLKVVEHLVQTADGRSVPALRVSNLGRATGRFTGFLSGRDAQGASFELAPDALPVLPGMTRVVGLLPLAPLDRPSDASPVLRAWPVSVKGTLELDGHPAVKVPLDAIFRIP
jgi:hypothetical protein